MSDNSEKLKILLIDDDDIALTIAVSMLSDDYDVTTVKSGKDALFLLLHDYKPDFILLDILMPEMDGWETFHKIRGISLLRHVPIAFLTSVNDTDGMKYAQEIGAVDFIIKPYEQNALLARVQKILSEKAS